MLGCRYEDLLYFSLSFLKPSERNSPISFKKTTSVPCCWKASQEHVWNQWFPEDGCSLPILDFWLQHFPVSSQPWAPTIRIGSGPSILQLLVLNSVGFVHRQTSWVHLNSEVKEKFCQQPRTEWWVSPPVPGLVPTCAHKQLLHPLGCLAG